MPLDSEIISRLTMFDPLFYSMMNSKAYVIDQNALREEGLILPDVIVAEPDAIFVVPDVAFVEIIKGSDWELTFRLSFKLLSAQVDRTFFSISVYEALNTELATKKPVEKADLLPKEYQILFRCVLREIASGVDGACMAELRAKAPQIRTELLATELAPGVGKDMMSSLASNWMNGKESEALVLRLRKMPRGVDQDAFRLAITKEIGDELFLHTMTTDQGMDIAAAQALLAARPMILRYFYGQILDSLDWAKEGGVGNATERLVYSRHFDMQHALIASYFDGLLTNDKRANSIYNDLLTILEMKDQAI